MASRVLRRIVGVIVALSCAYLGSGAGIISAQTQVWRGGFER